METEGKQDFISNSAALVPQELVQLSGRAQELFSIEKNPIKVTRITAIYSIQSGPSGLVDCVILPRSLLAAFSPSRVQQADLRWTNPRSINLRPSPAMWQDLVLSTQVSVGISVTGGSSGLKDNTVTLRLVC